MDAMTIRLSVLVTSLVFCVNVCLGQQCPSRISSSTCLQSCSIDSSCRNNSKCCVNSSGQKCCVAVSRLLSCANVRCPGPCTMVNGQPVCGCTYNGVGYNATSQFPAGDGCNNCYCRNRVAHCSNNSCATEVTRPQHIRPTQRCPQIMCPSPCSNGYKLDSRGCITCQCNEETTSPPTVSCPLPTCPPCPGGYIDVETSACPYCVCPSPNPPIITTATPTTLVNCDESAVEKCGDIPFVTKSCQNAKRALDCYQKVNASGKLDGCPDWLKHSVYQQGSVFSNNVKTACQGSPTDIDTTMKTKSLSTKRNDVKTEFLPTKGIDHNKSGKQSSGDGLNVVVIAGATSGGAVVLIMVFLIIAFVIYRNRAISFGGRRLTVFSSPSPTYAQMEDDSTTVSLSQPVY